MEDKTTVIEKRISPLDRFFGYTKRGGSLGGEVCAGIGMFLLSGCGIFMNVQLIAGMNAAGSTAADGEIYAQTYFVSMLLAFAGSLLIGLAARLPLVQVSSLGLTTVFVATLGTAEGLTYANLLVICLGSSIVYAVLAAVPAVYRFALRALPDAVRRALPAAAGLLLAWTAVQLTGIVTVSGSAMPVYGAGKVLDTVSDNVSLANVVSFGGYSYATDKFHPMLLISALAVVFTAVLFLLRRRSAHPCLSALIGGTVFFLLASVCAVCVNWKNFSFSLDSLWARIWMVGSEDAMQLHLSNVLANLTLGKVVSQGLDFSAYTAAGGNVPLLFVSGLLTFVFLNLYDAQAALRAVAAESKAAASDTAKEVRLALLCNAAVNVAAPLLGAAPISIGKESAAGARDGAKSGLASVVASLGFLISMFVWVVPFIFATVTSYDISFNMYGHYGTVLALLAQCSFTVADLVMIMVGLGMAARAAAQQDWQSGSQTAAFLATAAVTFFASNLAWGVAAGTLTWVLTQALPERAAKPTNDEADDDDDDDDDDAPVPAGPGFVERIGGVPTLIWAMLSLVLLVTAALL